MARELERRRDPFEDPRESMEPRGVSPGKRPLTLALSPAMAGQEPAPGPATSGGGRPLPLPLRSEMQSLLGIDLAAVRIHEGGEASAAGAVAFARGTDIHFAPGQYDPDSARGRQVLGHELAHLAQQTRGQVAATTEVGGVAVNDDPALEGEADRIGAQLASGQTGEVDPGATLQPAAAGGAVAQRWAETIDGNPNEATKNGNPITTHREPTLADAVDAPGGPAAAATEARQSHVMVLASAAHPFIAPPTFHPLPGLLYQETGMSPAPPGFTTIAGFNGTMAAPQVTQEATKSLYIDGEPSANDVDQGGLGDCYFLAAVMSVASRDPEKIKSMFKADGQGGATVTLWRAEKHTPAFPDWVIGFAPKHDWIPVQVKVTAELAVKLSNGKVHGAALRAAPNPTSSEHWAAVSGSDLEVHRKDLYDCARWAPLLEKAYARFAQSHGKYGGAVEDDSTHGSGIDRIGDGGVSHGSMRVLYGPASDDPDSDLKRIDSSWSPGGDLLGANAAVLDQLILLQGRDAVTVPDEPDAPILTASVSEDKLIARLAAAIPAAQADADWVNLPAERQALVGSVAAVVGAWQALPPDPTTPASAPKPKKDAKKIIGDACALAVRPGIDESKAEQDRLADFRGLLPGPITFARGDDGLPSASAGQLAALGAELRTVSHPQVEVQVDGYASRDRVADPQALSERRADAVEAELLIGGAVAPHTTATTGHGESSGGRRVEMSIAPTGHSRNDLLDNRRSPALRDMADLLLDLCNIGTDSSVGQRNVYGGHAYSVVSVELLTTGEVDVPFAAVPAAFRSCLYPLVDPQVSTVKVRNPHHSNEPDRHDNDTPAHRDDGAPDKAASDGTFTVSLRQFFVNFTAVTSGVFPKS